MSAQNAIKYPMVDVYYLAFTSWLFQLETEGLSLRQVQDTLRFLPVVLSFGECMAITQERRSRSICTLMVTEQRGTSTGDHEEIHVSIQFLFCFFILQLHLPAQSSACSLWHRVWTFTGAGPLLWDVADLSSEHEYQVWKMMAEVQNDHHCWLWFNPEIKSVLLGQN